MNYGTSNTLRKKKNELKPNRFHGDNPASCGPNWLFDLAEQVTVGIAALLLATICVARSNHDNFSTLESGTIRIYPSGAELRLPKDWVLYQTRRDIKSVRKSKEEWQREYAKILNAAIPLTFCSLHAGQYRWDSSVDMLQMRAYVLHSTPGDVEKRIATKGWAAAEALRAPTVRSPHLDKDEVGQWHRIHIAYGVSYVDYGGKANVDFYVAARQEQAIVLVFMYRGVNSPSVNQDILQSFSWPK